MRLASGRASPLHVLVGGGSVERGYLGINKAQIDRELAAMVGKMAEDGVGDHDASRILRDRSPAHFERPRRLRGPAGRERNP